MFEFFSKLPPVSLIVFPGPVIVFLIIGAALLSGYIKLQLGVKTNYTRKLFHVIIFSLAGILHAVYGVEAVNLLGILMGLFILVILMLGEGSIFFEGLAREEDRPQRGLYVLVPYLTTAAGGIAANILFPGFAVIGYLVNGWGDAAGEPVGVRFGRHPFRVPSITGIAAIRTLEGCLAVFGCSVAAAFTGAFFLLGYPIMPSLAAALAIGAASTITEAATPHGIDNLTIQVAASASAYVLLAG